ncbi:MAG: PaaI family thioesterase [Bacillota bacterium]|nr:PaaI family thioesterase [Bacillota bacterium]
MGMQRASAPPQPENGCFACGTENPHGLHLRVQRSADGWEEARFTPEPWHAGWPGIVHGGLVCTLMDEVMAYVAYHDGEPAVTARMSIEYRHPVRVGEPVTVRARRVGGRRQLIETEAEIRDASGTLLASARATLWRLEGGRPPEA